MSTKLLTFLGSAVAAFFWGKLISSFDVSSPPNAVRSYGPFVAAVCVGVVFLVVELLLRRPQRKQLSKIAFDSASVSIIGSFCLVIILILILVLMGFGNSFTQSLFREFFSALILTTTLAISVFLCVFSLRTIDFLIRRSRAHTVK
jgi:hypothetical protein